MNIVRRLTGNLGMLLLGLWLILTGLIPLLNLSVSGLGVLLQVLAIAAGVLILQGRWAGRANVVAMKKAMRAAWRFAVLRSPVVLMGSCFRCVAADLAVGFSRRNRRCRLR